MTLHARELLALVDAWGVDDSLLSHLRQVADSMRAVCPLLGEAGDDPQTWWLAGFAHDLDWGRWPDEHPQHIVAWLRERAGDPAAEQVADAVEAHYSGWGRPAVTPMAKALRAVDELSGFIAAYGRVRPGGLDGLQPHAVLKKLRQKDFARTVERQEIYTGLAAFPDMTDLIVTTTIKAMSRGAGGSTPWPRPDLFE